MYEMLWLFQLSMSIALVLILGRWKDSLLEDILPIFPIAMNLFVTKLLPLFGQNLPSGDNLVVAYTLGLNILAYKYGTQRSLAVLYKSTLLLVFFTVLTLSHTLIPAVAHDATSRAHDSVFLHAQWISLASWCSFYISQRIERSYFSYLIRKHSLSFSHGAATLLCQSLDTVLFTLLGLSCQPIHYATVILWSLMLKLVAWFISILGVHYFYEHNLAKRISI